MVKRLEEANSEEDKKRRYVIMARTPEGFRYCDPEGPFRTHYFRAMASREDILSLRGPLVLILGSDDGLRIEACSALSDACQVESVTENVYRVVGVERMGDCILYGREMTEGAPRDLVSVVEPESIDALHVFYRYQKDYVWAWEDVGEIVDRVQDMLDEDNEVEVYFHAVSDNEAFALLLSDQCAGEGIDQIVAISRGSRQLIVLPQLERSALLHGLREGESFCVIRGVSPFGKLKFGSFEEVRQMAENTSTVVVAVDVASPSPAIKLYNKVAQDPIISALFATVVGTLIIDVLKKWYRRLRERKSK